MRGSAGSAAAVPAVRRRNLRRGSVMARSSVPVFRDVIPQNRGAALCVVMLSFDIDIATSLLGARMQLSDRIGQRIKLHDLHVLMAVVQAGSMNKAAVTLNTTQSAVSRSIAELERTMGV